MVTLKGLFRRLIPQRMLEPIRSIRNEFFDGYCLKSYSQEGEDMILHRIFEGKASDFYVDVGAHYPCRFSESIGYITYYKFNEPALNTFDIEIANSRLAKTAYKLESTSKVEVKRLDQILDNHLPANTLIDFLSIDVEGFDFAVLKSNDWGRYRPKCVLVEALNASFEDVMHDEIFDFMKRQQYVLFAKTYNTLFFLNT